MRAIFLELEPVEPVRIRSAGARWLHVVPIGETVAPPRLAQFFHAAVLLPQPFPELRDRGRAVTVHAADASAAMFVGNVGARCHLEVHARAAAGVAFVPDIVAIQRGVILVPGGEGFQEGLRARPHFRIVETQSGESTGGTRSGVFRHAAIAVLRFEPGFRKHAEGPFGRGGDKFGENSFDPVLSFEVHHAVVIAPVVLSRCDFYCRPHYPVPEHVHADPCRSLVIALPILLWRVGFAEIYRAVREDQVGIGAEAR